MSPEDLPDGWRATTLGAVITGFESGRNLSALGRRASADELGVLKISAVTWGEFRPEENKALPAGHEARPHELVRPGDLLITRANTTELVGAVVLVPPQRPIGQARLVLPDKVLRILPSTDLVSAEYLLYALRTPEVRLHFAENATGTSDSMRNLSQPKLAAAPILVPPLPEQQRIVSAINTLLVQTNGARERLTRVREILKRFRHSVRVGAHTGHLSRLWRAAESPTPRHEPYSPASADGCDLDNPLELNAPDSWRVLPLGRVVANFDGKRIPLKSTERAKRPGPYPYYGASGVIDTIDSFLFDGDYLLIAEDGANLLSRATPIAFTASGRFWVNNHAHVVQPLERILLPFLEICVNALDLQSYVTGTAQPKLTQAALNAIPIPVPPLREQKEICRLVSAVSERVQATDKWCDAASSHTERLVATVVSSMLRGQSAT